MATGDLPGHLIDAIDTLMIWLFLITRSFWIILKRYIRPMQLTVEKANKSDHLADYGYKDDVSSRDIIFTCRVEIRQSNDLLRNISLRVLCLFLRRF